jgi:membrane associated rhomboid family serine protease
MEHPQQAPRQPDHQPIFNIAPLVIGLLAVMIAIHLIFDFALTAQQQSIVLYFGAFIPARYEPQYPFALESLTSTISYALLHGSAGHLISNGLWFVVFGSPLANTLGAPRFILFLIVCTIAAALFHYAGQPQDVAPMIGASGFIAGCTGAAARFGFVMDRARGASRFSPILPPMNVLLRSRNIVLFLAIYFLSNVIIGFGNQFETGTRIAWQAHIGGIVTGFLLISWFLPSRPTH